MGNNGTFGVSAGQSQNVKDKIRDEARRRGLLQRYEFSGVIAFGASRNDAAVQLMKQARARAFELLRKEFGASAHFWAEPNIRVPVLRAMVVDFYWRKANLGVELSGPLLMDRVGKLKRQYQISYPLELMDPRYTTCEAHRVKIIKLPHYLLWRNPSRFLGDIRAALVASGKYPNLSR